MADKPEVLFDINIILDVLAKREPHFEASARAWAAVETGQINGFLAAHSITTLFYLLNKHTGRKQAHQALQKLLQVFAVTPVDEVVIREALALGWSDFEDAVQASSAVQAGIDYLVTRNERDFETGVVRLLKPGDLPAILPRSE